MKEDLSKLPKWVRVRIEVAEMRLAEANERVKVLFGETQTDTTFREGGVERPLLNGARITFSLGQFDDSISVQLVGGRLDVNGTRRLHVMPNAANHVAIGLED